MLIVAAVPAVAVAAPGSGHSSAVGIGPAVAVEGANAAPTVFAKPVKSLRHAMRLSIHRARVARRARLRTERREAFSTLPGGVSLETLNAIAACESGGNPSAVSPDGTYRGKYQFDYGTWESVGGSGDPAAASEAEQDYRAALLYSRAGSSPWPICG